MQEKTGTEFTDSSCVGEFTMRAGVPQDAERLCSLHRRSILELGRSAYSALETESWATGLHAEGYVRAMTEGGERFEVAVDRDDTIVAFCSTRENEVFALFVSPDRTRQGIASTLLRRAEDRIRHGGHEDIVVHASLSGLEFYLAHGYEVVDEEPWHTRGGLVLRAVDLRKRFMVPSV